MAAPQPRALILDIYGAYVRRLGGWLAIADLIIRSDYRPLAKPELVRMLSEHRLKSPNGKDIIDILIRRLQSAS